MNIILSGVRLPPEVFQEVFDKLPIQDRYTVAETTKSLQEFGNDPRHWNPLLKPLHRSENANDAGQAKRVFRTRLAARTDESLERDEAGRLYQEIKASPLSPEGRKLKVEEITQTAKINLETARVVLDYKEIHQFFSGDHLARIGAAHPEAALTIFDRKALRNKLSGADLTVIGVAHAKNGNQEVIRTILLDEKLYRKLEVKHLYFIVYDGYGNGKGEKPEEVDISELSCTYEAYFAVVHKILTRNLVRPVVPPAYQDPSIPMEHSSLKDLLSVLLSAKQLA